MIRKINEELHHYYLAFKQAVIEEYLRTGYSLLSSAGGGARRAEVVSRLE